MTLHTYLLFVLSSLLLNLVPGPDMLFMLGRSIAQGRKAGLCAAFGINLGAYVHLIAALTGLSAILLTSATAFLVIKWIGAAYLIFLGIQTLRSKSTLIPVDGTSSKAQSGLRIFWQGFLNDVLNPKVAIFYLALFPQFVGTDAPDPIAQLLVLGITGNMVGICISILLVLLSTEITAGLRRNSSYAQWLQKSMGVLFVGLGFRLVTQKQ
jgi:threonine/homoserine/homoserine lactone efflux protein